METDDLAQIYVYLPDEDYSRPLQVRHLRGNLYQIVSEKSENERWQFTTGERVRCMRRRFDDGKVEMLAYAKIEEEN
jgi:hypothetical protein